MQRHRPLILFLVLLFSFPCYTLAGNDPSLSGLVPITLPGGAIIHAELADTPQKRATGLMYREHLDADRGMLFMFTQAQAWVFWMKNTKISLDLIWMNEKKQIIHIEQNVPICTRTDDSCPQYRPNEEALYVLELAAGRAESLKLQRGSKLQFRIP
ncbi:MAG: DUF192 domain-containing protein [Nitrospiraceae bacterium]|nr:DUF192 domain-containing protein [Nitrospiraceae bacterium]